MQYATPLNAQFLEVLHNPNPHPNHSKPRILITILPCSKLVAWYIAKYAILHSDSFKVLHLSTMYPSTYLLKPKTQDFSKDEHWNPLEYFATTPRFFPSLVHPPTFVPWSPYKVHQLTPNWMQAYHVWNSHIWKHLQP